MRYISDYDHNLDMYTVRDTDNGAIGVYSMEDLRLKYAQHETIKGYFPEKKGKTSEESSQEVARPLSKLEQFIYDLIPDIRRQVVLNKLSDVQLNASDLLLLKLCEYPEFTPEVMMALERGHYSCSEYQIGVIYPKMFLTPSLLKLSSSRYFKGVEISFAELGVAREYPQLSCYVNSLAYFFANQEEIDIELLKKFDTSNVMCMRCMFGWLKGDIETIDLSFLDTHNVTDFCGMFDSCGSLKNLNLSGFDTGNCQNFDNMFSGCSGIGHLDLSSFYINPEFKDDEVSLTRMFKGFNGLLTCQDERIVAEFNKNLSMIIDKKGSKHL